MSLKSRNLISIEDRGPLRVMFLITSMPVGGAETLLVNLIRQLDRDRFLPSLGCFKDLGPLGETLAAEIPAHHDLIKHKYDVGIVNRLARLLTKERIDAVVTVGAGDKMFWGRLAARRAGVPVILSALHSTGWPDGIGRLNRLKLLTRWTDGFIGVAEAHARHLRDNERFPATKVHVIPNGVDTSVFHPARDGAAARRALGLSESAPVAGIVAALRPEKNHELFLRVAARVRGQVPDAQFIVIGDGPEREKLERLRDELNLAGAVHMLGTRSDIPDLLSALDVFVLTSRIEANPVSILEAMSTGKAVVAPRVGSIAESVLDGKTGFLTAPHDEADCARRLIELLSDRALAVRMGRAGREEVIRKWSLERMVEGYQDLIAEIYRQKTQTARRNPRAKSPPEESVRRPGGSGVSPV